MADVQLTIDDVRVTAPQGATILDAAQGAGIEIPHLCYEPQLALPPLSTCRLCLVEVEGMPRPVTSCSHPVEEGMVVRTRTHEVIQMRRMLLELLLSDHPHDCLTCEQAGRCALQKYAYELNVKGSPYPSEAVCPRPVCVRPSLTYDRGKCILCGRCVQMCHEVQASCAIEFYGRGFETRIAWPGPPNAIRGVWGPPRGLPQDLTACVDCGNCIAVCPTGAIIGTDAEGAGRTWDFRRVRTVCPYCGVGCTIVLNVRGGRIANVTNETWFGVGRGLTCVKGRFGIDFVHSPDRLTQPLLRRDGKLRAATWDEALDYAASRLREIRAAAGPDAVAGLASAKCTNEENYLFQKFMRAAVGTNNVDHCARLCHASTVTGLTQAFGSGAMTNSIEDMAAADAIFVIGSNATECHPIIGSMIKRRAARGRTTLIVADPRRIDLAEVAAVAMSQRPGTDVALLNAMMHVILREGLEDRQFVADRTEGFEELRLAVEPYTPELAERITGVPAADIARAARLYAEAPAAAIVYSMGITQHTTGTDNVLSLANLAMLTGNVGKPRCGVNALRGQNNVQGACDMGALPNVYPGYQPVDNREVQWKFQAAWKAGLSERPGLTVIEMMHAAAEGRLHALYVMGENPVLSDPDVTNVEKALRNLDLLVVQDIFPSETAQLAHVVLPAASFAEKEGTFTNTERRVQRLRKAVEPPGQARADWEILCDLARRMGYEMSYRSPAAVLQEIAGLTPIYGGVTMDRLEETGVQWPCTYRDHPGTAYLHEGRFTRGRGKFHAVQFVPAAELPDEEYPFLLSTGRILQHFHTGTMTRRSEVLDVLVPSGSIEIHPDDADRLGVADDQPVRVASRRGEIRIAARLSPRVLPGTVFLAFHYREAPANRLTLAALDPAAKIPEFKVCAVRIAPD